MLKQALIRLAFNDIITFLTVGNFIIKSFRAIPCPVIFPERCNSLCFSYHFLILPLNFILTYQLHNSERIPGSEPGCLWPCLFLLCLETFTLPGAVIHWVCHGFIREFVSVNYGLATFCLENKNYDNPESHWTAFWLTWGQASLAGEMGWKKMLFNWGSKAVEAGRK